MSKFTERAVGNGAKDAELAKREKNSLANLNAAIKKIKGNISDLEDEIETLKNADYLADAEALLFSESFSQDSKDIAAAKLIQAINKDNIAVQEIEQKETEILAYLKYLKKLETWKREWF